MDAREFLGLRATTDPLRWQLEVVPGVCTDGLFLFGGCGLGAAIEALGEFVTGSSLDNTVRVCSLVPTDWVLIDVQVHAVANGFGHGRVNLWAQDGTLLAAAGQSCALHAWRNDRLVALGTVQDEPPRRTPRV